jgi:hypothetical protein
LAAFIRTTDFERARVQAMGGLTARAGKVAPMSGPFSFLLAPLDPLFFGFLADNVILDRDRLLAPFLKSSELNKDLPHGFGGILYALFIAGQSGRDAAFEILVVVIERIVNQVGTDSGIIRETEALHLPPSDLVSHEHRVSPLPHKRVTASTLDGRPSLATNGQFTRNGPVLVHRAFPTEVNVSHRALSNTPFGLLANSLRDNN